MANQAELRAQMNGLVTEPSRIIAGSGGFVALDNAMCRSPGLVEPRGGLDFHWNSDAYADLDATTVRAQQWQGHVWTVGTDGTNTRMRMDDAGVNQLTIPGYQQSIQCELMADRQAWSFSKAARMQDLPGASTTNFARMPGSPRAHGFYATTVAAVRGGSLPTNSAVAYRVVVVRHPSTSDGDSADTHRASLFGAPSERRIVRNNSGATVSASISVPVCDLSAGDEIQIYRTPTSVTPYTGDPGDEMQLRASIVLAADVVYNGTGATLIDDMLDAEWFGPALYTNATQDGILLSNYRARTPTDIAYYNGMAFYAGDRGSYTATVNLRTLGPGGLCSIMFDGTAAVGSPVITAVTAAAFPYFHVGMEVRVGNNNPNVAGASVSGKIVSFSSGAATVTIDTNAAANYGPGPLTAWDWVGTAEADLTTFRRIFAEYVNVSGTPSVFAPINPTATGITASGTFAFTDVATLGGYNGGGQDMERAWSYNGQHAKGQNEQTTRLYVTEGGPNDKTGITLTFERDCNNDTTGNLDFTLLPFVVVSTATNAFSVTLSRVYTGTVRGDRLLASRSRLPSSLIWSKKLQPEAVPLPYQLDIGTSSEPIVRVIATNDRLWIFKTDGLWSAYGDTPESLTFQQVDPTLRLTWDMTATATLTAATSTAPWVTRLGNEVFAWTSGGIFKISSAGVQRIDGPIETDIRKWTPRGFSVPGGSLFSTASINDSIVLFGIQNVSTALPTNVTGITYAYHTGTQTWCTWSQPVSGALSLFSGQGASDAGNLVLGGFLGWITYNDEPRQDSAATALTTASPPLARSDRVVGAGATAASATSIGSSVGTLVSIQFSTLGLDIPDGMLVVDGSAVQFRVISTSGLGSVLDRAGCAVGACTLYWPIIATITYSATTQGAPAVYKAFQRAYYGFQSIRGGLWFSVAFRVRGETSTTSTTEYFPVSETIGTVPTEIGLATDREYEAMRDIPTSQTLGTGLETTITISQAAMYYALDSLTIVYDVMGPTIGGRS